MITVFTPTYNRASFLNEIFDSLCKQTYRDFEWVIVDDGSTDETIEVVSSIHNSQSTIHNSSFPIRYFYQENGGKHRAINRGVKEAQGELFLILDSDDLLTLDSLHNIVMSWEPVKHNPMFGGVCGLIAHRNGEIIGNYQRFGMEDMTYLDCRYVRGIKGDMAEVYRTDVMREFPFPEYENERFCPEALVWNRIATKYKLKYFDKVIYYRDYIGGGLTDRIVCVRKDSPMASTTCYQEITTYAIPLIQRLKAAANYWRFRLCATGKKSIPKLKWYWNIMAPLGWLLYQRDKTQKG